MQRNGKSSASYNTTTTRSADIEMLFLPKLSYSNQYAAYITHHRHRADARRTCCCRKICRQMALALHSAVFIATNQLISIYQHNSRNEHTEQQ